MLPIYYINLAKRTDRRAFMDDQLAALGLKGTRVEAVTPADLTQDEIDSYCDGRKPRYLRRNELACTKSHERAWQMMIDAGQERALILEDDAELSPKLPGFLAELDRFDFDIVRLEATGPTIRVFPPVARSEGGIDLRPFRSTPVGAAGYILKQSAARQLLGHPAFRVLQTDLVLYNPFDAPGAGLSRVQTVPGLCQQLGGTHVDKREVGRSDIAHVDERHIFAIEHPVRFRWIRFRAGLKKGLRNALDHFASKKQGLTRMRIPFADKL
jgi:glycosyl transferase family 25